MFKENILYYTIFIDELMILVYIRYVLIDNKCYFLWINQHKIIKIKLTFLKLSLFLILEISTKDKQLNLGFITTLLFSTALMFHQCGGFLLSNKDKHEKKEG